MSDHEELARQFEHNRAHLHAVAYRMRGTPAEADDAVQEAWLRLSRYGADEVHNLGGWLTTMVARVCLDMLRLRASRREDPLGEDPGGMPVHPASEAAVHPAVPADPESEAVLADSVGAALVIVLDTLTPAERLAFVLHNMFAVPFSEIAPVVDCSPAAARQLASRARRRVRGAQTESGADAGRQRTVVEAFLAAARGGDFAALLEQGRARGARPALVDGLAGAVWAPGGRPRVVFSYTVAAGKITAIEVAADADLVREMDLEFLGD
ncbi:MAG TPA: sigma-70 family RNA polymerase sigma factor [Streptosporangiaceae bacterium]|nr:sigma-70 family RNA polymerase sigma factor [Streptosporangiaceae bacterium]